MALTRHRLGAWDCRGAVALCVWFLTGGLAHAQPEEELEALNRSAIEHHKAGKVEEAILLAERSVDLARKRFGEDDLRHAAALDTLAALYRARGRYEECEALLQRALAIAEKAPGTRNPDVGRYLNALGALYAVQKRWAMAVEHLQRGMDMTLRRITEGVETADLTSNGAAESAAVHPIVALLLLVKTSHQLARGQPARAHVLARRSFETAQWAQNWNIGASLTQMTSRRLDGIVPAPPEPLSVAGVQDLLTTGEALVLFLDTPAWGPMPEETFVWAVTKTHLRWVRIDLGATALNDRVQGLRCGLDPAAWHGEQAPRCHDLLGIRYTGADHRAGTPLPFDLAPAHHLYQALFGPIEDLIAGKQLLLVPSGPLARLPFHVLVTEPVDWLQGDGRKPTAATSAACWRSPAAGAGTSRISCNPKLIAWLVRRHAAAVLPSVAELERLRRVTGPSRADVLRRAMLAVIDSGAPHEAHPANWVWLQGAEDGDEP